MDIGQKIKEEREKQEMTQYALAKKIGVNTSTIQNIENGNRSSKRGVGTELLDKIAESLGLENRYLVEKDAGK